jgi:Ca2+-binding EF-hand superfamily protein
MGNKSSQKDMPPDLKKKCLELFSKIDVDGSKTIDKQETLKFWGSKFAQLNSEELFASVDKNNDGSIQEDEWIEFWYNVWKSGQSKDEIMLEVRDKNFIITLQYNGNHLLHIA